ncbi:hypothetical protein CEXT_601341 [Caerostris extrusa]|uniref:Uncharacterized protein n=1 Tax=Caerostris extrusa TaxID=172846 RepID=A0AAV4MXR0_CAEEX|nr:hypothetical protein CEXT_601341 [Caerostris extrusa]
MTAEDVMGDDLRRFSRGGSFVLSLTLIAAAVGEGCVSAVIVFSLKRHMIPPQVIGLSMEQFTADAAMGCKVGGGPIFPAGAAAACSNPAVQNSLEQKNPRSDLSETFAPCSRGATVNIRICF